MTASKKSIDGVDEIVGLFPRGSAKMIERILARAAEAEARRAGQAVAGAFWSGSTAARSGIGLRLAGELGKALRHRS